MGWRNRVLHFLNSWEMDFGLYVALYSTELKMELGFINVYRPYAEREGFWNHLLDFVSLNCSKIIFGGDLNFSIGFVITYIVARLPYSIFQTKYSFKPDLLHMRC